jgi:hypothetical protein
MPRGDRTGPMGMGPRTGRAAGFCAGYDVPGYMNPTVGRGAGFGAGRSIGWGTGFRGGRGGGAGWGRGWRWRSYAPADAGGSDIPAEVPYTQDLLESVNKLREELAEVSKRISELESKSG